MIHFNFKSRSLSPSLPRARVCGCPSRAPRADGAHQAAAPQSPRCARGHHLRSQHGVPTRLLQPALTPRAGDPQNTTAVRLPHRLPHGLQPSCAPTGRGLRAFASTNAPGGRPEDHRAVHEVRPRTQPTTHALVCSLAPAAPCAQRGAARHHSCAAAFKGQR